MENCYIDIRKNGTYRIRVIVKVDGKKLHASTTYYPVSGYNSNQHKKVAENMGADLMKKVEANYLAIKAGKEVTFEQYYRDQFCDKMADHYADTTCQFIQNTIEKLFIEKFGNVKMKDITQKMVQNSIQELANKANENEDIDDPVCIKSQTVKRYITILRSVINMALTDGVIEKSPFVTSLRYPTVMPTNFMYLSKKEVEIIVADLHEKIGHNLCVLERNDVIVATCLFSGVRRGELIALTWGDLINLDGKTFDDVKINISHSASKTTGKKQKSGRTKTPASTRMFVIPELLARVLWAWKQKLISEGVPTGDDNFVICSELGEMVSVYSPTRWFKNYLDKHKFQDVRLHSLRHTFASMLLEYGVKMEKLKWLMGHTSTETTQIYVHLFEMNGGKLMTGVNSFTASLIGKMGGEENENKNNSSNCF